MWKFNGNMSKEKWLMVLAAGICLMLLAIPSGSRTKNAAEQELRQTAEPEGASGRGYEKEMEKRVEELLSTVDGVGKVDVMITLSSSEEKVLASDRTQSQSSSEETDSAGGTRSTKTAERQETTVLAGGTGDSQPIVEMERMPEIRGVVVSAQGGGDARIQAEISAALEALFHVPQHKIRVLKRVE